jgi:superfamily II DNA or RNA helicase
MKLRDYQLKALDQALADFRDVNSALIVMATGLGKTVTFGHIAKHFTGGGRVMILAHREELIRQAADKVGQITGRTPDIEMGLEKADAPSLYGVEPNPVVVSSIQTQIAGMGGKGRMTRFSPSEFSLVIVDEAHHAAADSYRRVIAHYRQNPACKILGVTATPDRADEAALGQVFERVSYVFEINDAIDSGWLVPITQRLVHVDGLDFTKCRTTAGDLNGADLAAMMEYEANLHGIAHPTYELADGRKTLVFAASVAHAERLCEILNRHKPNCARFVSGSTDDVLRRRTLRDYRDGAFQFLVNCAVFAEGFDEPGIEVVAVARPTKSRALYWQMIGRGTRPLTQLNLDADSAEVRRAAILDSDKPCLEVLDFVGNAGKHKLMTTADILGGVYSDAVIDLAEKKARDATEPVDMRKLLQTSEEELERRRKADAARRANDAATRAKLVGVASYSTAVVNAFDVLDIAPALARGWDVGRKASPKQVETLRNFGVDGAADLDFNHASQLLGTMIGRAKAGLCSWKQARILKRFGYPAETTKGDAKKIIDAIAKNGWQKPGEAAA